MTFDAGQLRRRLLELQGEVAVSRYLVGFSGGLDSTVLVHALKRAVDDATPVIAVHINHGLHPDAGAWEAHCRHIAGTLNVGFLACHVDVSDHGGAGIEAAAREKRYAAMKELVQDGDVVLSAHHEEDQAETLLLNLMRGSGLAGLAAIGARQQFGPGTLIRPMLKVSREDIERYAREAGLAWVEDPANANLRFDRSFLRREILPRLRQRWPAVSRRLANSAELAGEAARLQDDLARLDLSSLVDPRAGDLAEHDAGKNGDLVRPDRLEVAGLRKLGAARQRNVLRFAIRACGLPPAPATRLRQVQDELLTAREDAEPLVRWRGAEVRRFRRKLYLLPELAFAPRVVDAAPPLTGDGRAVDVGTGLGTLRLRAASPCEGPGIDPVLVANGLQLKFRTGGERIRPYGRKESRPLKKLLQEHAVVPWMRQYVPLLYAGETLAAVADLWIDADCARDDGFRACWEGKPSLF
jgi:tRNA(Ile)-lysidine synthase